MLASVKQQAAIDFVRQDHDVAVTNQLRNLLNIPAFQNSARRIFRRVQDNQPGAVIDQRSQFIHIERKIPLLAQGNWHGASAYVMNHRFVNRKARIGIDDLISLINQGQDREENNWLAAWNDNHFVTRNLHSARAADVFG